jgi:hypothetical protein
MVPLRDPDSMTDAERRHEVASILARGLLRTILSPTSNLPTAENPLINTAESGLDLSRDLRLSVAHDPPPERPGIPPQCRLTGRVSEHQPEGAA